MRKTAASLLSAALAATATAACAQSAAQPELGVRSAPVIVVDGLRFKDLDRNGKLDPYEDWRLTPQARARDLTARMTLEEKAGAMMHGTAPAVGNPLGMGSAYDAAAATAAIGGRGVNSMITRLSAPPAQFAEQNNALQAIAEATRLGVPLTLSTDPRNHIQHMVGVGVDAAGVSIGPYPPGLAAIGDPALTRRFGDIARREYRAVGIHEALSPQADLATEPRWPRVSGTFGEDADLAGKLVQAYIEGFQNGGGGIGKDSVLTVVKHWAGYGASRDGFDGHTYYGRYAAFPGGAFAYHLKPFEGAFAAKVAGVMPTYDIIEGVSVDGAPLEPVAAGFSRQMLTGLLRGRYGFEGVILSDWAITNDCNERCRTGKPEQRPQDIGMPWGVEDASVVDRFAKGVVAGLDQFGGVDDPAPLLAAVREGKVPAARLDDSVRRIMEQKFAQGLFENPYVDPEAAARMVGRADFKAAGLEAQSRALTVLENRLGPAPLAGKRVYLRGVDAQVARARGLTVVDDPAKAEVALVRLSAPHQLLHPGHFFGRWLHEGDLDFKDGDPDYEAFKAVAAKTPTAAVVYLDRPAILTGLRGRAAMLVADFGASDQAVLDALTGKARAEGRLPFELPSSMEAVARQKADLPHDSADPLYPIFYRAGDKAGR